MRNPTRRQTILHFTLHDLVRKIVIMKVFLGNPPWNKPGFYGVRAGSRWPHFEHESSCYMPFPFQLAYAAALLEKNGFDVLLVDAIAGRMNDQHYLEQLTGFNPDLIIHEISTISLSQDIRIIDRIRDMMGAKPKVAVCGLHVYAFQPSFLDLYPQIDFSLIGEYELTALELAWCLAEGKDVSEELGILYRNTGGKAHANPRRPLIKDLNSLPWPARHFLPMQNYHDRPGGIPKPSVQMWSSRGCPFRCNFCAWPQIMYDSHSFRARDPIKVVDEMEYLVKERGFKSVYFDDDTFNVGKSRVLRICSEIKKRQLNVPWAIMARADLMDEELLKALKGAGLHALKYGVESADQEIVRRCGKQMDIKKTEAMIQKTRALGILYHLTFTFGLPGETRETIKKSLDWCLKMDPDTVQFSLTTPFPGSRFYEEMDKEGRIVSKNWEEYDGYFHGVVNTEHLTARELEEIKQEVVKTWEAHAENRRQKRERGKYLTPGYIAASILNPRKAVKKIKEIYFPR
jgi:anaerobic magnesium-protoporphyrin IX monomethyl ester cyclase